MKTITKLLFLTMILTAFFCISVKSKVRKTNDGIISAQATPESLVRELYKTHNRGTNNEYSPFFQTKNRTSVDKFFAKNLADLIWNDVVGSVHKLDFDPLYASVENREISKFVIGKSVTNGGKASILVEFEHYGDKQMLKYMLIKEKNRWKIEDTIYENEDDSLAKILRK